MHLLRIHMTVPVHEVNDHGSSLTQDEQRRKTHLAQQEAMQKEALAQEEAR